ncbi:hypothetical protein MTO96_018097 [Rhipicephalus appendiculatus]
MKQRRCAGVTQERGRSCVSRARGPYNSIVWKGENLRFACETVPDDRAAGVETRRRGGCEQRLDGGRGEERLGGQFVTGSGTRFRPGDYGAPAGPARPD